MLCLVTDIAPCSHHATGGCFDVKSWHEKAIAISREQQKLGNELTVGVIGASLGVQCVQLTNNQELIKLCSLLETVLT